MVLGQGSSNPGVPGVLAVSFSAGVCPQLGQFQEGSPLPPHDALHEPLSLSTLPEFGPWYCQQ
jgi:hypothetical protein